MGHLTIDEEWEGLRLMFRSLGGGALYGSMAALGMGWEARALVRIGLDFPDPWLRIVSSFGVELRALRSGSTTRYAVVSSGGRSRRILTSSAPRFGEEEILSALAEWMPSVLHVGSVAGEVDPDVLPKLSGVRVGVDAQGFVRRFDEVGRVSLARSPELEAVLGSVDVLHANSEEAAALTGSADPAEAAEALSRLGPAALVSLGDGGLLLSDDSNLVFVPAYRPASQVSDVGAGDVLLAVFLISTAEGADPVSAAVTAAAAAGLSVSRAGPDPVDRKLVEEAARTLEGGVVRLR